MIATFLFLSIVFLYLFIGFLTFFMFQAYWNSKHLDSIDQIDLFLAVFWVPFWIFILPLVLIYLTAKYAWIGILTFFILLFKGKGE